MVANRKVGPTHMREKERERERERETGRERQMSYTIQSDPVTLEFILGEELLYDLPCI